MKHTRRILATQPELVTIPRVELLEVGENWETSTGVFTFDTERLVSCIASQDDPAVRTPVIKLGHVDPRFDGQPSFGRIINLRLENNDQTLVCDFAGVPLWMAQTMASAFPRRSIEGLLDVTTRTGNEWPMVLTGVALLGDAYPAIETLEDIQALWGSTPPKLYPVEDVEEIAASSPNKFIVRKDDTMPSWLNKKKVAAAQPVKASVSIDSIRVAYYAQLDRGQTWWWIREMRAEPLELIVDDDEGHLYRVPVTINGEEPEFGEPSMVKIEYVAASGAPTVEQISGQILAASYDDPEASGRTSRPDEENSATLSTNANASTEGDGDDMLTEQELAALGLPADATREQVADAIMKLTQNTTEVETETAPEAEAETETAPEAEAETETAPVPEVTIPEGMVLVDASTLEEMRSGVAAARGLVERQEKADRDEILDSAIRAGKFPLGRRPHYEKLLLSDPLGGKALITSLEPGVIPVAEIGGEATEVAASADYPAAWKRSIEAGRALGDRVKVIQD